MLRQIGLMATSTYLRLGVQVLAVLLVARLLGLEQFGQFAYWFAVAQLAALPVNYGFGQHLLRELGREPARAPALVGETWAAQLTLAVAVLAAGALAAAAGADSPVLPLLCLGVAVVDALTQTTLFALRGLSRFDLELRLTTAAALLQFGLQVPAAWLQREAVAVAAALLAARVLGLGAVLVLAGRCLPLAQALRSARLASVPATLRDGLAHAADTGLAVLNGALPAVLLSHLADLRAVGLYAAGQRLTQVAASLAPVLGNVYTGRLAAHLGEPALYRRVLLELNRRLLGAGCVLVLALGLAAPVLVRPVLGEEYRDLAGLLPWFALLLALRLLGAGLGINLAAAGGQRPRAGAAALSTLVLTGSCILAAPSLGALGALYAGLGAAVVVVLGYAGALRRRGLPYGLDPANGTLALVLVLAAGGAALAVGP